MPQSILNPYAPPAYSGLREVSPQFKFETFVYSYQVVLTALQVLTNQQKTIEPYADFVLQAISIPSSTGTFEFRYSDSRLYWTSDARLPSTLYTGQDPYPVSPSLVVPAAGRIGIEIADTSAAGNTIVILFHGANRMRIS